MSDKNDKLIKKMAGIIKKQQALINKLAADKVAECQPGDPMCGEINGYKLPDEKPKGQKPAPKPQPKPQPKPDTNKADIGLPADLKAALDVGAPHLRGSLNLAVKGNTVDVRYNADLVKGGGSKVKEVVQNALANAGYTVVQCIGDFNPAWRPNYV